MRIRASALAVAGLAAALLGTSGVASADPVAPADDAGTTWDDGTTFLTVDGMPAVKYSGLTPRCAIV